MDWEVMPYDKKTLCNLKIAEDRVQARLILLVYIDDCMIPEN